MCKNEKSFSYQKICTSPCKKRLKVARYWAAIHGPGSLIHEALRMHIYDVDETPGNHDDDDGNFGKTIVFTSKTTALSVHHAF